ncbi:transporter [Flavobacterium capsici]|uniref:Transporter n=1 Tax=Flavobacterium capsici TaxID=3075618 RepID=A0AA96J827_9FLAO|nr:MULTISPECIES: transporter [unclassified Flavobacterium]WNM17893.1 transporter [Flavobacterium sp. PMR2A8]WNM21946.1 transporter [Flavobacterium sp. PMTSA4]
MQKVKALLLIGFLMSSTYQFAQYTDIINSNRPGKSQSAFSVGKTVFQAEGGIFGIREKHDLARYQANGFGSELSVRYGAFFEQFEMMLDMQYQYDWYQAPLIDDTRGGFKQMTFGAKYLVYDPFKNLREDKPNLYSWNANHSSKFNWKQLIPAVALYAGLNIKVGNNPFYPDDSFISPKAMLITQNHFGTKWVFVNNVYFDKLFTDYQALGVVSTLTRGFNMRWSGFLEFQGIKSDLYADYLFRVGAAYLIKENIQIDASISKNVKDTPEILYGGVGLSWRFDQNYEKVYLRSTKPVDKEKGKDKKSKKDKKKKRKDAVEPEELNP